MRTFLRRKNSQRARIVLGLLALCVSVSMIPAVASAQSAREMSTRLQRLENEIETLNRAVYRGEAPPAGAGYDSASAGSASQRANNEVRLQQLETELRSIRGLIEEQNFNISRLQTRLERSLSDMELRLNEMEGRGGVASGGSQRQQAGVVDDFAWNSSNNGAANSGASSMGNSLPTRSSENTAPMLSGGSSSPSTSSLSVPNDTAAAAYENAFALLKSGNYEHAGAEFIAFTDKYPDHVLVPNAKYWLGETFYVRGDYERAARVFAEGYKADPQGAKAADNLLKLSLSLIGAGNTNDACVALDQLNREFSGTSTPVVARAKQEMTRLGCD